MCEKTEPQEEPVSCDIIDAMVLLSNEIHCLRYDVCKIYKLLDQFAHKEYDISVLVGE